MNTIYIPVNRIRTSRRRNTDIILAVLGTIMCFGMTFMLSKLWDYSNHFIAAAVISSVNASVWESVKIICIPMLLWFALEYFLMHINYHRMTSSAAIGVTAAALFRIISVSALMGILGFMPHLLDLCLTGISMAFGQWAAVKIQRYPGRVEEYFLWAAAWLGVILYALLSFTVNPPNIGLFADPVNGSYGFR